MKKIIGYETKEYGRKVMVLEEVDEISAETKAKMKAHAQAVREKMGYK